MKQRNKQAGIQPSTILMVFVAILAGLGGTYALRAYANRPVPEPPPAKPPARPRLLTVPLASRPIAAGTRLTLDDVALFKMTQEDVKNRVKVSAFMTNPNHIIGRIALHTIEQGEAFTTSDFFPAGEFPGIGNRLKSGFRAVTVVLTPDDALNGYASPGQRVDVLFHYSGESSGNASGDDGGNMFDHHDYNPPRRRDYWGNSQNGSGSASLEEVFGSKLNQATTTLIQDVEILALGARSVPTDKALQLPNAEQISITLAVRPHQAELLNVAKGHGRLSFTMRGPEDAEIVALVNPVTIDEIMDGDRDIRHMEIYRGKQLTRLQFGNGQFLRRKVFADPDDVAASVAGKAGAASAQTASDAPVNATPATWGAIPYWGPFPNWLQSGGGAPAASERTRPVGMVNPNAPSSAPEARQPATEDAAAAKAAQGNGAEVDIADISMGGYIYHAAETRQWDDRP